ncbi:MAG: nucleotidyltransferase [Propionibacteriaceae bacterium]|nr:nucleotidyltransferase [Propionibacteriaceae bacterium]
MATPDSVRLRNLIATHRDQINDVLLRYGAKNPRLFGSVARGDAGSGSDIDLVVDLIEAQGSPLLRLAGLSEELAELLGVNVDVISDSLMRRPVSAESRRERTPL